MHHTPFAPMSFAVFAATAGSQPIAVVNHSFESDPADPGCFEVFGAPAGWSIYDPLGIASQGNFFGVIDPGNTPYFLPGQVPDGDQVALLFFSGSIGQGELGIAQQLGVNLEGGRRYRLSAGVGNIASGASPVPPCSNGNFFNLDGFPGYAVQLVAGGAIIAEDRNSLFGMIPEGEFRESVVEAVVPSGHPQIGTELEIRLINLNEDYPTDPQPGIEVDFDDVGLEVLDAPCLADTNADGLVTPADFNAWILAFNTAAPACDQNGDGLCTPADFNAWIINFNAGCP